MTKKTNILIIISTFIAVTALGFSIFSFVYFKNNMNNDDLLVGKWISHEKIFNKELKENEDFDIVYEFKKDGTCIVNEEFNCIYNNGMIAFDNDLFGQYYIDIKSNDKLRIINGSYHYLSSEGKVLGDETILERSK